ncbi:phosphatidate phosphatase LPIN3 [Echinops telfairi]|uniref:Phosphatidate phosphatase LPIN3 n=1 Tax=Echinops telfairi TaxID=9371 RepID=A0AC55DI62_ECHTE|nr:phosphatidate phosphatase LPIN3 [Echinops telfairi]
MNYVGQLAGTVFGTVKELYRGLNPATLSGGIDVLVVEQQDGSFRCSPFHVRFGKLGVLRSREKVVDIEINGEPVDLHMKLGDSGEAFFVQELESDEELVPPRLCTSPLPWGGLSGFPSDSQWGTASEPEGSVVAGGASTGRKKRRRRRKPRWKEGAATDSSSEELEAGAESGLSLLEKPKSESLGGAQAEGESSPRLKDIYPYSDGEWTPQTSFTSDGLASPKSDSELELRASEPSPLRAESHMQWSWGRLPKVAKAEQSEDNTETLSPPRGGPNTRSASVVGTDSSGPPVLQTMAGTDLLSPDEAPALAGAPLPNPQSEASKIQCSGDIRLRPATKSWSWAALEDPAPQRPPMGAGRREGSLKRSQHLGPSDIYLDDLPSLDSENVALYFPQSDCGLGARRWSEPSNQKLLGALTSEPKAEPIPDAVDTIALSLCGGLADSRSVSPEKFTQHAVSYQDLCKNPSLLEDPNLVVEINKKHYNWAVAAPMILSLQAFQKNLPQSAVDKLEKEKMPRKGGRWWFSWRRRDLPPQCLNLHKGANDVVFSVTTQYQGTCRCKATIYLWKWDDKVVISDIDGTITKSDALGHILPQLGRDWTHPGITSLYHKIHLNGYKFLYCSARAIGMADLTKGYLRWVSERGYGLPKGPILLSPSSLFSALHR